MLQSTKTIKVDFNSEMGSVKPLHAVNNGPAGSIVRGTSNSQYFTEAGIPYARLHDSASFQGYGGDYSVDVHRIFRNFDADVTSPESYIFTETDQYIAGILKAGVKVFYRLGAAIEHLRKNGTYPPKDFNKWAVICEHIIRHYTEGWANGFYYDIEYWEIWNEPDCYNPDGSNPCWQGTEDQFVKFFTIVQKHLKTCFPHLKIGGPAFAGIDRFEYAEKLLSSLKKENVPLDFFSFHLYTNYPRKYFPSSIKAYREQLIKMGFVDTELILNEWNYIRGWVGEDWKYSLTAEKNEKGASFIAAAMALSQENELDMLMYYDARPCVMNGMFTMDTFMPLKGYYPFKMFNELYKMGTAVKCASEDLDLYVCAAKGNGSHAVMFAHYNENDSTEAKEVSVFLSGLAGEQPLKIQHFLLDKSNDMSLIREEITTANDVRMFFNVPLFSVHLLLINEVSDK